MLTALAVYGRWVLLELAEASCAWTGGEPRPLVFGETAVEAQLVLPPAPPKGKEGNRRAPSAACAWASGWALTRRAG